MTKNDKYILFIPSGGMNHMLGLFASVIQLAIKHDRIVFPITEPHNAFGLSFGSIFKSSNHELKLIDHIDHEVVFANEFSDLTFDAIKLAPIKKTNGQSYYHLKDIPNAFGSPFYLMHPEIQGVENPFWIAAGDWSNDSSLLSLKNLSLNHNVLKRAVALKETLPEKYIACHYRNTDYKTDLKKFCNSITKIVDESQIFNIFVATDDISSIDLFKKTLKHCNVSYNPGMKFDISKTTQKNSHFPSSAALSKFGMTKFDQHAEFFSEIYVSALADLYLPNPHSSIRHMVSHLRSDFILFNSFFGTTKLPSQSSRP